jgi:hypothetical protein
VSNDESYNGWTNWDTWEANQWLCADEAPYRWMQSLIRGFDPETDDREELINTLADTLRAEAMSWIGYGPGITGSAVDWGEIAVAFVASEIS